MKKRTSCGLLVVVYIATCWARAESRPFTVRDDIAMVRFNDPSALANGATAKFSPDGRYFVIVSSRGLIASDQIESTISIYSSAESRAYVADARSTREPQPRTVVTFSAAIRSQRSSAYDAIVTDLRWALDSSGVYFIAEGTEGNRRLYRMDIATKKAHPLSLTGYNVVRFDFTKNAIVFDAWRSSTGPQVDDQLNRDAREVAGESLEHILFPNAQPVPVEHDLWLVNLKSDSLAPVRVPDSSELDISWLPEVFSLSPRGHLIVRLRPVEQMPANWTHYEPETGSEFLRLTSKDPGVLAASNTWRLKQYSLVNLDNGKNGFAGWCAAWLFTGLQQPKPSNMVSLTSATYL